MTKRKMIVLAGVCTLIAALAARTLSQTDNRDRLERLREMKRVQKMSEAERQRYAAKKRAQAHLEQERTLRKSARTRGQRLAADAFQREKMRERSAQTRKEFLIEKAALAVTEEQWKFIKPKLQKVAKLRNLWLAGRSTSGVHLGGSSTSGTGPKTGNEPSEPRWQWKRPWKDIPAGQRSEAQKLAQELIDLVERKNVATGTLRRTMDALRRARIADRPEQRKRLQALSDAKQELRKGLTTRQEAALALMGWL